ncbi:transcriptional regulator LeuO [Edwardsiella ictaluri]|uniref:transcriptional regulator LeuO n=1 Tax=Edwardsiella ictaluri TaxID=67780 RepID=UPI0039F6C4DF
MTERHEHPMIPAESQSSAENNLRNVDLNLLTVFDAVMQVQSITRAARSLNMTQPAVSNAVARLKLMFNDELFMRYGRGIRPTNRAYQLFGPVRQALQIVRNELPGARFKPESSERVFNIAITSPLDILLTAKLLQQIKQYALHVQVSFDSLVNEHITRKLRYQESDFLIDYQDISGDEFCCEALFDDEFVLAVAGQHPRIGNTCSLRGLLLESHAVVSINQFSSVSRFFYAHSDLIRQIAYQGTDLSSVLGIVSKTDMVAIAPRWMVEQYAAYLQLRAVTLLDLESRRTCFFNWHRASERDSAHVWLRQQLSEFAQQGR